METNKVATALKVIGIICIISGLAIGLVNLLNDSFSLITFTLLISSVISGILFLGFGEVIILLQKNYNIQKQLLNAINQKSVANKADSILQDIESNLPLI